MNCLEEPGGCVEGPIASKEARGTIDTLQVPATHRFSGLPEENSLTGVGGMGQIIVVTDNALYA